EFILGRAWQCDFAGDAPDVAGFQILGFGVLFDVNANPPALRLLQPLDRVEVDTTRIVDDAVRVRARDNLSPQRLQLLHCVNGNVAGAGDEAGLTFDRVTPHRQHLLDE